MDYAYNCLFSHVHRGLEAVEPFSQPGLLSERQGLVSGPVGAWKSNGSQEFHEARFPEVLGLASDFSGDPC